MDIQMDNKVSILEKNNKKFSVLKKYNLPLGSYSIGGSGPLGIRGLREIRDIDILVLDGLRDDLIKKYGMIDDVKVKKVLFPEGDIEAFWEGSFEITDPDTAAPLVKDIIARAEIIDGLAFECLDDFLYFKRKMNREKDLIDIKLILEWENNQLYKGSF
jgi:hypothetical protein